MAKKKVCVIINPVSGTGGKQSIPEKIASAFDPKKYDVIIRLTGYAGHATEITKSAVEEDYKYVIDDLDKVLGEHLQCLKKN